MGKWLSHTRSVGAGEISRAPTNLSYAVNFSESKSTGEMWEENSEKRDTHREEKLLEMAGVA